MLALGGMRKTDDVDSYSGDSRDPQWQVPLHGARKHPAGASEKRGIVDEQVT